MNADMFRKMFEFPHSINLPPLPSWDCKIRPLFNISISYSNYVTDTLPMNKLVQQFNNIASSFREHVVTINLESMPEVLITAEQTTAFNEELGEQDSFLNFHLDIGTRESEIEDVL